MSAATFTPPTDRQVAFYNTLAGERGMPTIAEFAHGTSRRDASRAIDAMMALPKSNANRPQRDTPPRNATASAASANVPDGRYALPRTPAINGLGGDDATVFIRVSTGQRGKWEGFRFVERQVAEASEPVRDRRLKAAVMDAIAADLHGAAALYGQKIGRCGFCHIALTDDDSRALGIGPDCFEKHFGRRRTKADVQAATATEEAPVVNGTGARKRPPGPGSATASEARAADAAFEKASKRRMDAYARRIPVAVFENHPLDRIVGAIQDDECLTDEHTNLLVRLATEAAEGRFDQAMREQEEDEQRMATIAKAYRDGNVDLAQSLESDPGYRARLRNRVGW